MCNIKSYLSSLIANINGNFGISQQKAKCFFSLWMTWSKVKWSLPWNVWENIKIYAYKTVTIKNSLTYMWDMVIEVQKFQKLLSELCQVKTNLKLSIRNNIPKVMIVMNKIASHWVWQKSFHPWLKLFSLNHRIRLKEWSNALLHSTVPPLVSGLTSDP